MTALLITIDRGPDAAPGECGTCDRVAIGDCGDCGPCRCGDQVCLLFHDSGAPAFVGRGDAVATRLPACLAAERTMTRAAKVLGQAEAWVTDMNECVFCTLLKDGAHEDFCPLQVKP